MDPPAVAAAGLQAVDRNVISYQKAQLEGLSQRDLIVMCYKGAVKYLNDARQRLESGDGEGFSDQIEKAHRVIFHLYTTLDTQQGGEIAQKLADIYAYLINQIYLLNATKNLDIVDGINRIMNTLREGWEGIDPKAVTAATDNRSKQRSATQRVVSVQI
jgi:flagellar secretion chaperone FliS